MPMTTQPMALAELMARVRFSCCWGSEWSSSNSFLLHVILSHLEYRNVDAGVDDPLVYGVRGGEVDHLAEDHAVVHLLVQLRPALLQLQLVSNVRVLAEVRVDPVSEGCLLLFQNIFFNISKYFLII